MRTRLDSKPNSVGGSQHLVSVYFTLLRGVQQFSVSQVTKKKITVPHTSQNAEPPSHTLRGLISQAGRSMLRNFLHTVLPLYRVLSIVLLYFSEK